MAAIAMKKGLTERARKKAFDAIFLKFDHNQNGNFVYFLRIPFIGILPFFGVEM